MDKRGQMFLIAALFIVVIITSIYSIKVFVKTYEENTRPSELVNEIEFEGISVVDYGTYNDLTTEERTEKIEELMSYYTESNPNAEIKVVIGNQDGYVVTTGKWVETGGYTIGGTGSRISIPKVTSTEIICSPKCEKAVVTTSSGNSYDFDLTDRGNNFYVVFYNKEDTGEITVATNK